MVHLSSLVDLPISINILIEHATLTEPSEDHLNICDLELENCLLMVIPTFSVNKLVILTMLQVRLTGLKTYQVTAILAFHLLFYCFIQS